MQILGGEKLLKFAEIAGKKILGGTFGGLKIFRSRFGPFFRFFFAFFKPFFFWSAASGGVTSGGLRGVWPPVLEIGLFRPFSAFFEIFQRA